MDTPDCVATTDPDVEPSLVERSTAHQVTRGVVFAVVAALVVNVAVWATSPSNRVLQSPGPVLDIVEHTSGDESYPPPDGHHFMTTVRTENLDWWQVLAHQVIDRPGHDVMPAASMRGGLSEPELQAVAIEQMTGAQRTAGLVASARVHGTDAPSSIGVGVVSVVAESPAWRAGLRPGDIVTAFAGTDVRTGGQLIAAVETFAAAGGGRTTVTVLRDAEPISVPVDLDGDTLGVMVEPVAAALDEAPTFDVDTEGIGGPSGGLMFTLAFIDIMSPGDLTAGLRLAGTGTIDLDGSVGPVGGTQSKVHAAAEVADVFFVPAGGRVPTAPTGSGLTVVPVDTVDDAIAWLCAAGATDDICG